MSVLSGSGAHTRKNPSAEAGFTLLEVLLAMTLLSAATLGLVHLAAAAMLTSRSSLSSTSLGVYAENALEAAQDRGFAGTTPGITTDTLNIRGVRYARRMTIVDRSVRAREIRVDISRVGATAPSHSTLTYLVR